jgi:hypothetical protein
MNGEDSTTATPSTEMAEEAAGSHSAGSAADRPQEKAGQAATQDGDTSAENSPAPADEAPVADPARRRQAEAWTGAGSIG